MPCELTLFASFDPDDNMNFTMDVDRSEVLTRIKKLLNDETTFVEIKLNESKLTYLLTKEIVSQCIIAVSDNIDDNKEDNCKLVKFKPKDKHDET